MIPVTKTFLPPIEEYTSWVQKAFDNQWLTNRGELIRLLEDKLKDYLDIDWITITNNGTVPLQIALKLLDKETLNN
jgi:dTDP-4-amino-4,6-dideoxygalactose transaminase